MRRWILGTVLALAACGSAVGSGGESEPAVGEDAVDGQFTFVVESFECGATEVKDGLLIHTANAEFCLLHMTVTNTGDEGRDFLSAVQGLFSYSGGRLTPSNEATLILNPDVDNEAINPGLSIDATVVFDIADPDDIEFAHLKDAPLSQGVKVRVGQERG